MSRLLQRYILGQVIKVFLSILAGMTLLLVFVGVFQQAAELGLTPQHAVRVLPYIVPSLLPFTIPAAMLLTVSVVYGRLSGDQEVIAAKAAGIHPVSLMWPAFALGLALSIASLVLTDRLIPWSISRIEQHVVSVMEELFMERLKSQLQYSDRKLGLHINVADVEGHTLIHPVIQFSKGKGGVTTQAELARIRLSVERQEILVQLKNGFIEFPDDSRVYFQGERSERFRWETDMGDRKARHIPITEIYGELDKIEHFRESQKQLQATEVFLSLAGADFRRLVTDAVKRSKTLATDQSRFNKLRTEVHSRCSLALSCFFFTLLGVPVAVMLGKSQFATSFLFCFLPIVCGYYPLTLGLMSQAKNGSISPDWSMWVANVLVMILGGFAIRKVIRY
ncbi:putative permease YjgP/YjgQ family protein [Thalassoglobus neptunius]|uniref:Putative permease YjgP/YjgQ family protein n=1 Tax=Thalassoglobus neptunius TaxID=1938619 RepID=A0A5C5X3A8_9PLAN|nr:LptF/LptG family permease [Thalassoglobus neptunius]TWT57567.1 putative permease YjgP/YjgQ family protein [Thalassoglobus neptunius]